MNMITLLPDAQRRAEMVMSFIASAVVTKDGKDYMQDGRGALMPVDLVRPIDRQRDTLVRSLVGFARDMQSQMRRFKDYCYADLEAHQDLVSAEYNAPLGGKKGNITLTSYDQLFKVQFAVADQISFDSDTLHVAKTLFNECLTDWTGDNRDEIKAIINDAFAVSKAGDASKSNLFRLTRINSVDERWNRAKKAILDSVRAEGTALYVRFYFRDRADQKWSTITLDFASV